MTNKTNTNQSTNSDVKKESTKRKTSHSSSKKVIKDGKVMVKKKKKRSSHNHHTKKPTTHSHKKSSSKKVTPEMLKEQSRKKMVKRLSAAAIIIGTLGLSTTAVALSHPEHEQEKNEPTVHIISKEYTPGSIHFEDHKKTKEEVKPVKKEEEKPAQESQQPSSEEVTNDSTANYQEQTEPELVDNQVQETSYQDEQVSQAQPAMTLNILGQLVNYQNGGQSAGQSVIDANSDSTASTWGGASVFSGNDGMNTHFIGHNPGAFSIIFSLSVGNQISVTDANGTPKNYVVNGIHQVYDNGTDVNTGEEMYDSITGTGGGERITLQSCINNDVNLIVFASAQ